VCVPPRYAYWTILIDDKPTAFRAREREELQPTFVQLQRKNTNVVMRWFARGKLWASREAERDDFQMHKQAASAPRERRADRPEGTERRGSDWRPGGAHKDPRDRFKKKNRPERAWSEKDPATQRERDKPGYKSAAPRPAKDDRPWRDKPRGDRPWSNKPASAGGWRDKPADQNKRPWSGKPARKPWSDKPAPPSDRPWQTKPTGPRAQRQPWVGKPPGDRVWNGKPAPAGAAPRGDRPWRDKPGGAPRGDRPSGEKRPWTGKPRGEKPGGFNAAGPPRERKPWSGSAAGGPRSGDRPWSGKPAGTGDRKPWPKKPFRPGGPQRPDTRKRRDDEPPDRD
jgi:hypothetical protein